MHSAGTLPEQRRRQKGFTLVEILIVIAIVGGLLAAILASTGTATEKREVRRAVQDVTDISGAISGYYGSARIPTASAPDAAAMESVAAGTLERMQNPTTAATRQTIVTQFGTSIDLGSNAGGATYSWPNYWIHYTGMRAETCAAILGALTGPIRVRILVQGTALSATWVATATDHRVDALTATGGVQAFCEGIVLTNETFVFEALFRV